MGEKRVAGYSAKFQRIAVERMKGCNNIRVLADELGVDRKSLYLWRDKLDPESVVKKKPGPAPKTRELELEQELARVKRVLADKTLELDFFKGALRRVEERRRQMNSTGGKTSTTKSGK